MKRARQRAIRQIVLLRHGESVWNKENLFTGRTDVDLSEQGKTEGIEAGRILKEHGFTFDIAFTSVLKRAIWTLWLVLDQMDLMRIPVQSEGSAIYLMFNAANVAGDFSLPPAAQSTQWHLAVDTSYAPPQDFFAAGEEPLLDYPQSARPQIQRHTLDANKIALPEAT